MTGSTPDQKLITHSRGRIFVVIDIEDRDSSNKYSMMTMLMYPEDSKNEESLSNPPPAESTPDPGPPSENLPRNRPQNPILMPY